MVLSCRGIKVENTPIIGVFLRFKIFINIIYFNGYIIIVNINIYVIQTVIYT